MRKLKKIRKMRKLKKIRKMRKVKKIRKMRKVKKIRKMRKLKKIRKMRKIEVANLNDPDCAHFASDDHQENRVQTIVILPRLLIGLVEPINEIVQVSLID